MAAEHDLRAQQLMMNISHELDQLRQSLLRREVDTMESHTRHTSDMLTELRLVLLQTKGKESPELLQLREAVFGCAALIHHLRGTVRSMLALYRNCSGFTYSADRAGR